jgi:hypothetical protein
MLSVARPAERDALSRSTYALLCMRTISRVHEKCIGPSTRPGVPGLAQGDN